MYTWLNILLVKFIDRDIPKPYKYVKTSLHSDLDITGIISQVCILLPQLNDFITQFNSLVVQSGVNVITDSIGNMSIDVPETMSDIEAHNISKRFGIIDRLINSHGDSLNDLFKKGLSMEEKLKLDNPSYTSQLTEKLLEFKKLNASYKH